MGFPRDNMWKRSRVFVAALLLVLLLATVAVRAADDNDVTATNEVEDACRHAVDALTGDDDAAAATALPEPCTPELADRIALACEQRGDFVQALGWLRRSATAGSVLAQQRFATLVLNGLVSGAGDATTLAAEAVGFLQRAVERQSYESMVPSPSPCACCRRMSVRLVFG